MTFLSTSNIGICFNGNFEAMESKICKQAVKWICILKMITWKRNRKEKQIILKKNMWLLILVNGIVQVRKMISVYVKYDTDQ